MKRDRKLLTETEPDLTPMIDVVFLLLVFFMCTLTFAVLEGRLATHMPKDAGPSQAVADLLTPLELGVVRDASRVGGVAVVVGSTRKVSVSALPGLIAKKLELDPELRAKITTGEDVTYGQAVSVLDACVLAGMTDVMFTAIAL
ncbi:MAG: ExbD/TolR family protein [Planctomycetota bacterium]|jgi:biopolymer transport protein ExbD